MGFRVNGGGGVVWRAEHSQSQMEFRGLTILFIIVIMIIVITLESTYLFELFPGVFVASRRLCRHHPLSIIIQHTWTAEWVVDNILIVAKNSSIAIQYGHSDNRSSGDNILKMMSCRAVE